MAPWWRPLAAAFIVPVALGACGGSGSLPASAVRAFPASASPATISGLQPLLPGNGTYAVLPHDRFVSVWRAAGLGAAPKYLFDTQNPFGDEVPLLVTGAERDAAGGGWLKVLLPIRPNGASGWVKASDVRLIRQRERIVVDLSSRMLRHYVDGELVDRFSVGIGRPEFPTATGTFYVWGHVPQASPTGPYGDFALPISGFSEVLKDWPGGGRMAIHGTADPGDRGQMVSHGCIRVYNPDMLRLRRVPLGTPVVIKQ